MFDIISNLFSAWNQIGLIIMSLVFLLIGGGMMGYEIYWRMKAKKIKGRISEVRYKKGQQSSSSSSSSSDRSEIDTSGGGSVAEKGAGGCAVFFFLIFPLVFAGFGTMFGYNYLSLSKTGMYADAVVIRNESSTDSDGATTYKAILKFTDEYGKQWEVRDSISYGSSPSYKTGTQIGVYYRADNPKKFVIDDFWHNMAISIAFVVFGLLFVAIFGAAMFFSNRETSKPSAPKTGRNKDKKESFLNDMYYAVYEYRAPNGELREKVSGVSSSNLLGKLPGTKITLLMFPDNPDKVRRPSNVLLVIGLIFLLPGLFIGNIVVSTFEMNFGIFFFILLFLGFIGFKIKSGIDKIPKDEFKKGWEEFKKDGVTITSSDAGAKNATPLDSQEMAKRIKYHARNTMIGGYVMLVIALGCSVGAYYAGLSMINFSQNALSAKGEVVSIESRSSDDGYTYYSVVKFTDRTGAKVRFKDSVGSSHALHKRGDMVDVLYLEDKPEGAMIDRGIFNWGLSGGLGLVALLALWGAFHSLRIGRLYGGPGYRSRM